MKTEFIKHLKDANAIDEQYLKKNEIKLTNEYVNSILKKHFNHININKINRTFLELFTIIEDEFSCGGYLFNYFKPSTLNKNEIIIVDDDELGIVVYNLKEDKVYDYNYDYPNHDENDNPVYDKEFLIREWDSFDDFLDFCLKEEKNVKQKKH